MIDQPFTSALSHPFAAGALISFVVFPAALGIVVLARRTSAAARHMLLLSAFVVAAIALPIFVSGLRIAVPILPAKKEAPLPLVRVNSASPSAAQDTKATEPDQAQLPQVIPTSPTVGLETPVADEWKFSASDLFLGIWLLPFITLSAFLAIGLWRISELRRKSTRVVPSRISTVFHRLCAEHKISNPPALLISEMTDAPFACGVVRSFIVLPRDCGDWSSRLAESILLHELAHCIRHDVAAVIFARVVASVFWFNPFAWICLGKLRAYCEMSADDYVVTRFDRADDYAGSLLDQLKQMRTQAWWKSQAIGIVRKDGFEERIERILDNRAVRKAPGASVCVALLAMAAFLGAVLPILQPVPAAAASIGDASSLSVPQAKPTELAARRGKIFDRKGELLVGNALVYKVVADGRAVKDPAALARVAAPFLKIPEGQLRAMLQTEDRYKVLQRDLPGEDGQALYAALAKQNLQGIYLESDFLRTYPAGLLAGDILGFVAPELPNANKVGKAGVERVMEPYLQVTGSDAPRHFQPSIDGRDVYLTIDAGLQRILEGELDAASRELKPEGMVGVLIDPRSGEILAMANRPGFNPGNASETSPESLSNPAISAMYEPGTIFRIVAVAAALEEGKVNSASVINGENGSFEYMGRTFRDRVAYDKLTVSEILTKSSSIGTAKLALLLGDEKFHEYSQRFGFGDRTGVELPGESPGRLFPVSEWDRLTLARMASGGSVASTPLQIAMGMSVIANRGMLMRPHIIREIKEAGGNVAGSVSPEKMRDVISPETARTITESLRATTEEKGSASLAGVKGLNVAGKASTAPKISPEGNYSPGKYVASFVGFLPTDAPQLLCLILVDDAKVKNEMNYGSLVAAPIFARVAEKSARHLGILP